MKMKHGLTKTVEHKTWQSMRSRCNNANAASYKNYGGRGIKVCDRWDSFVAFLADVGPRPSSQHSLDRINNNGNYEPSNVRWATRKTQNNNTRHCTLLTFDGRTLNVKQWAKLLGLNYDVFLKRIASGMSFVEAATQPLYRHYRVSHFTRLCEVCGKSFQGFYVQKRCSDECKRIGSNRQERIRRSRLLGANSCG